MANADSILGPQAVDLTDRIFGRLTVKRFWGRKGKHLAWECECSNDGNIVVVTSTRLLNPNGTRSCGCLQRERTSAARRKHGGSGTLTYVSWAKMIERCTDERHPSFKNYGARGIRVCERWMDFESFLADMGERPSKDHSIDRHPDPNGNYEAGNCRWATRSEQNSGRRFRVPRKDAKLFDYNGEMLSVGRLAALAGVPYHVMDNRLRAGWDVEKAVSTPCRKYSSALRADRPTE